MIAATAIQAGAPLATANPRDSARLIGAGLVLAAA
jgi:predicted nucleic acid-binding protein